MPWLGTAALALLAISLMLGQWASIARRQRLSRGALATTWLFAFLVPGSVLLFTDPASTLDPYYAILSWLIAASVLPASNLMSDTPLKKRCQTLAMIWLLFGTSIWVAHSYLENRFVAFHLGLAFTAGCLLLWKRWFHPDFVVIQAINTLLLVCLGVPLADLLVRPRYRFDTRPENGVHYYSYERASKNPESFARWWDYYLSQWHEMEKIVFMPDPEQVLPFRLKPGTEATFFESRIRINSLGFRGKEVPFEKGQAFRIVAIGESTTFGCTLNKDDRTWPALLEQKLNEGLKLDRPIQVINGGVPSYNVMHSLHRLEKEILPLKPDMIIAYHGYNGLTLINEALPPRHAKAPPAYKVRPLKLLAQCEYRLKMSLWKQRQLSTLEKSRSVVVDPMETEYARGLRELIRVCRANDIPLVLATFSMAVSLESDSDQVEFYRGPFHAVHWEVQANAVLATIVKELAEGDPNVYLVDTQPVLDGRSEYYTDIVHFTQPGREKMSEIFFNGIREPLLATIAANE